MLPFLVSFGLKLITSNLAKTIIAIGVKKLIEVQGDGITKDVATLMIEGIAKSKHNPTTEDVFKDALELLTDKE